MVTGAELMNLGFKLEKLMNSIQIVSSEEDRKALIKLDAMLESTDTIAIGPEEVALVHRVYAVMYSPK